MTLLEVYAFIRSNKLAVVSTIDSDGKPQSAVVEFGVADNQTLIIDTFRSSRKYQNLQHTPHVAIVIGWDKNITIQISAVAHEIVGDALTAAKQTYFAQNPRAKKWENRPDLAYFCFKPTWIRYADLNPDPWVIQEFDL